MHKPGTITHKRFQRAELEYGLFLVQLESPFPTLFSRFMAGYVLFVYVFRRLE
jgi:hypothetical protein